MIILGIGDAGVSKTPGEIIKTYALGSCVALVFYSSTERIAGMAHIALSHSNINPKKAQESPAHFADTAVPYLIKRMSYLGVLPPYERTLHAKLIGGANILNTNNVFKIGKRNVLEIKKQLWKLNIIPVAMDVEGTISRTVSIEVSTGKVTISSANRGEWTI